MRSRKRSRLAFGQRIRPLELDGILRGDHHERPGQPMRLTVGRHLPLTHRLQQGALRARRGAVDLVGQHHVGENRPRTEDELMRLAVVEAVAGDVGRQQVGRKLDAVENAGQAAGDRLADQGLAHAGNVLQQDVLARQEGHNHQPHGVGLAKHYAGNVLLQSRNQVGRFVKHVFPLGCRSVGLLFPRN